MGIRSDWSTLQADQFLRKYAPIFSFLYILSIVTLDLILPKGIILTWQLIALILLLVVIPFVPLIKRVSYGEWEAELETLVRSAEDTVEPADVTEEESDIEVRADNLEAMLERQLEEDSKVALAKLRIELEEVLRELARNRGFEPEEDYIPFHYALEFVQSYDGVIDQDLYDDILRVREVANEAIHGGEIDESTARRIIRVGIRVLERLYYEADRPVNPDPSSPAFSE